jgi:hypothetical protein
VAGRGLHFERATQARGAFLHSEHAQAAVTPRIKANAIVFNGQREVIGILAKYNADFSGVSVVGTVVQCFLNDTIHAGLVLFRECVCKMIVHHVYEQACAFGNLAGMPLQRRYQSKVIKHGGAKEKGHVANLIDASFGEELDSLQAFANHGAIARAFGKILDIHQQGAKRLRDLVVKIARERATFLFLGVNQAFGERL